LWNDTCSLAPLQQFLDNCTVDPKQSRQGMLQAAVFVIATEDFLRKIGGMGLHG
jgi:hypothetical protein